MTDHNADYVPSPPLDEWMAACERLAAKRGTTASEVFDEAQAETERRDAYVRDDDARQRRGEPSAGPAPARPTHDAITAEAAAG